MTEPSIRPSKPTQAQNRTAPDQDRSAQDRSAIEAAYARVEALDSARAQITEFPPQYRAKLAIQDEKKG